MTAVAEPVEHADRWLVDRREVAGAVADIGVLVPIAATLIVANGLSATAALLPAALLYLAVAFVYRLPIPVQPLKAFGAIAIAQGLGSDAIAAGALLMGVIFVALGASGLLDAAARIVPKPVVRGVQLTVGLLFLKIAWGLVSDPPAAFTDHGTDPVLLVGAGLLVLAGALALKRRQIALVFVVVGAVIVAVRAGGELAFGPAPIHTPALSGDVLWAAFTLLVIPQLPLTFANSCVATADAASTYFGDRARGVRPGRLAVSLGTANLLAGTISGMPVCHGAGGLTAHRAFGARSAAAPLLMGLALLTLALVAGQGLAAQLAAFPVSILGGMLAAAGLLHLGLLRDLTTSGDRALACAVGAAGFTIGLAPALAAGLAVWWLPRLVTSRRERSAEAA